MRGDLGNWGGGNGRFRISREVPAMRGKVRKGNWMVMRLECFMVLLPSCEMDVDFSRIPYEGCAFDWTMKWRFHEYLQTLRSSPSR